MGRKKVKPAHLWLDLFDHCAEASSSPGGKEENTGLGLVYSQARAPAAQETHSITIVTVFEVVPAAVTTTLISPAPAKLRGSGPMLT